MPFSAKAHHLFSAIEHGWTPPKGSGIHISREDATKMAHEGVKDAGQLAVTYSKEAKRKGQKKALHGMGKK